MPSQMCRTGKNIFVADAAHCDGVKIKSYSTTFEVVGNDANNSLFSIFFSHYIGVECKELWEKVFTECKSIDGFDIATTVTTVDQ